MVKPKALSDIANPINAKQQTPRTTGTTKKAPTKDDIQQRLRAIGAKVTGSKSELEKRLKLWEDNNLGRQLVKTVIVPARSQIDFPPADSFSPLKNLKSSDMQAVTLTVIDDWFEARQAKTSKENGRELCLRKFVKSVLVLKQGDLLLVKGKCAAQTKRSVEYNLGMVFNLHVFQPGIFQAGCQCPAGTGFSAACKHLAALAYCIEHYARSGDSLELLPCTSTLQSWHRPPAPGRNLKLSMRSLVNPWFLLIHPVKEQGMIISLTV